MEITEINMISEFEAGMKCLQNPRLPQVYGFWKWGALIFAIFATFSSLTKRIKLLLIRFHTVKPFSPQHIDFTEYDDVSLASSSDDDDDVDIDEQEDESDESPTTTSFRGQSRDFSVKGSRHCFSGGWPEFAAGKNVVKLWDRLGLTLDFDEDLINANDSGSVVSMWDSDKDFFPGGVWSLAASPAVVLKAEKNGKGDGVVLGCYDARMGRRVPALFAEWRSPAADVDGITVAGGGRKFYVRSEVDGVVTVGDVRNIRMPLESVREVNGNTWWDADAVIVGDESS